MTRQALFETRILEDRVRSLELQLPHQGCSFSTPERGQYMQIKQISGALDETRMALEESKVVIDQLL
jgi:hypothetical protein